MHQVEFHKRALKTFRRTPEDLVIQIITAIDELANAADPTEHPGVKLMQGKWSGSLRLRVGKRRVIFRLISDDHEPESMLIYITPIGTRGDIYG